MSTTTAIGWTEKTWNPVVGCTRVSAGCDHCYAVRQTFRLGTMGQENYRDLTMLNGKGDRHFNGTVRCLPERLGDPLHWRKPCRIFVNSMSDLFHERVPFDFIDKVFAVMALCPQHEFQLLSKRPDVMATYLSTNPLDRLVALLHNVRHEQGTDTDFERALRDRLRRNDLADCETPRPGRQARGRLLQGSRNQRVPQGQGGIQNPRRISVGDGDDQQTQNRDGGASDCMDLFQQIDSTRVNDKPQRRSKGQKQAGQFGIGNISGTKATCIECSSSASVASGGGTTSQDASFRSGRPGDAPTKGLRTDGEGHCRPIQYDEEGDISHMLPSNLEAYLTWPLPGVWLGVSCEDQATANERMPILLQCPAAVRFVSLEPLLGPINLERIELGTSDFDAVPDGPLAEVKKITFTMDGLRGAPKTGIPGLSWVIVGGESGPKARPCELAWIESIVKQCKSAGVPCFVKQDRGPRPGMQGRLSDAAWAVKEFPT